MKRDWDVIRDVLIEVEGLTADERHTFVYGIGPENADVDAAKSEHALLLWKANFISAIEAPNFGILAPELTWQGHDLLETMRSKAVWERIKTTAKDKGIELTFDAVKAFSKAALDIVITS